MQHVVYIYSLRLPPLASAAAFPYLSTPIFQLRSHLPTTPQTNQSESRTESEREIIGGDTIRRAAAVLHAAIWPLQRSPPRHRGVSGLGPARIRIPGERGIVLESWDSKRFKKIYTKKARDRIPAASAYGSSFEPTTRALWRDHVQNI